MCLLGLRWTFRKVKEKAQARDRVIFARRARALAFNTSPHCAFPNPRNAGSTSGGDAAAQHQGVICHTGSFQSPRKGSSLAPGAPDLPLKKAALPPTTLLSCGCNVLAPQLCPYKPSLCAAPRAPSDLGDGLPPQSRDTESRQPGPEIALLYFCF